ncbi:MAG: DUF421 domain-containing protein [Acidobacteriota bacterium]|nr:DUF421 domain-containing protein [Acidobacteriota bacterium]
MEVFNWLLGLELDNKDINFWQMSLRAVIVFILSIIMLRIGHKRFMGRNTALDVMLGIVFGSMVSRAITGNAPFFPALAASLTLVLMHWIFSFIAFHWSSFGSAVKGKKNLLIKDGEIQWKEMKKTHITEDDLSEALRSKGEEPDFKKVKSAHLERNGDISLIMND